MGYLSMTLYTKNRNRAWVEEEFWTTAGNFVTGDLHNLNHLRINEQMFLFLSYLANKKYQSENFFFFNSTKKKIMRSN